MKVNIQLKRRDGKAEAKGVFEDGKVTVKKGSVIKLETTSKFKGFSAALEKRNDTSLVDKNGLVKKDVTFNSPSTAGVFVLGSSVNGWATWKTSEGKKLSEVVKEK